MSKGDAVTQREHLENNIHESCALIREFEDILRLSDNPKKKGRARRALEEQ
jgi:hypothetical protein